MSDPDELICVASIAGAFGVRGEVRLKSFTADPEAIEEYNPLMTEDGSQSFEVGILQPIKNGLAVRLSSVSTKEEADALKGVNLYVPRGRLPSLPDDEFYHTDLIGLEVVDTGGTRLGKVKAVQNHGAGDLLEIHGPGLKATVLLPFTRAAVPTVDLSAGRVIADPPEGLFPDPDAE
jgi:16S rRNA processing protein RimM